MIHKANFIIFLFLCLLLSSSQLFAITEEGCIIEKAAVNASGKLNFKIPHVPKWNLYNGIPLYVYSDHEIPIVIVRILIRTGSSFDFERKEGLAEITGRLVRTGGTAGIPADTVDEMLDQFAGHLDFSTSADTTTATLSVLKGDLDTGLMLLSKMILNPAFEEQKLQITKNLKIEELRRFPDDPFRLARREFNRQMYKGDPRGRYPSAESVESIKRDDLVQFHKKYYLPHNMMIAISGDITSTDALNAVNKHFGTWSTEGIKHPPQHELSINKGGIYFVRKDVPQSVILMGYRAPGKKDHSYYPFSVFDFIIGSGSFTSRIFQKVRTDRGLAYSTGSFYRADVIDGQFVVYAITKSSSTLDTLRLLQSILNDVHSKGVTNNELSWAKKSIDNGFIFSFLSADQIAYQQMRISYDRLPDNYLSVYRQRIDRINSDEIRKVVNEYILKDSATVLILGNDEALRQIRSKYPNVKEIDHKI